LDFRKKLRETGENSIMNILLFAKYCIIKVVNSKRIRWAENLALMGEKINAYRTLVGNPEKIK
jgi:hypothetical protein